MVAIMATRPRIFSISGFLLLLFSLEECVCEQVKIHQSAKDIDMEDFNITVTYMDTSGLIKTHTVKSSDLSSSWVIERDGDEKHVVVKSGMGHQDSSNTYLKLHGNQDSSHSAVSGEQDDPHHFTGQLHYNIPLDPKRLERRRFREERRIKRTEELLHMNENDDLEMQLAAIERSKRFGTMTREHEEVGNHTTSKRRHSTLNGMKDQIIMLRVYSSIARTRKMRSYSNKLNDLVKRSLAATGLANSDAELKRGALDQAQKTGRELSKAKDKLYDCEAVERKLRAMAQSLEETVLALQKKNYFLTQVASWTIPKSLHCLHLQLANDYFLRYHSHPVLPDKSITEDPSLYHYAIFSDNVLSTSVVVKSAITNAKEPEKHVFHIVTDGLNYPAMKMWFIAHPSLSTVEVRSMDHFKWLNSSYCPVLRQLESAKMKEFYFKAKRPSHLAVWDEHLKVKNPKYLSMLNHIRFYMPEMFPKLDKMVFLDDDVVVKRDLTPLWFIDMKGMVNGAVETCNGSYHEFGQYLNFTNPQISDNFDRHACGWAYGMNIFDLKLWRKNNLTAVYHYWQELNEDRLFWRLGTLPPGLCTFYKLTYVLDKSWHLLTLGYNPSIPTAKIENAAVLHYNGNYKPWLDVAVSKYKGYWSKYVNVSDPYLRLCNLNM